MHSSLRIVGSFVAAVGLVVLVVGLMSIDSQEPADSSLWVFGGGAVLFLLGAMMFCGLLPERLLGPGGIEIKFRPPLQPMRKRKELSDAARDERDRMIETLPGAKPGQFRIVEGIEDTCLNPSSLAMTPAYTLDEQFRIIDWNPALSQAFDHSMEGFRGQTVGEWIFYFANCKEIGARGIEVFKDKQPEEFPLTDVEDMVFKSDRYGTIVANKRAYKIHDGDQQYQGWLVIMEPNFDDSEQEAQYKSDLLLTMRDELMWSEYALSYDVLNLTKVYPELVDTMLGANEHLAGIPSDAFVIDLGAGTGNISERLADSERRVFAVENNPVMLQLLKKKCRKQIRYDDKGPGVIPIRQDVNSLYGLPKNYFHFAILNNVLYSLPDPLPCLKKARELLRKGGEIRLSGPHNRTRLDRLLRQIKADLKAGPGLVGEVKEKYEKVEYINRAFLEPRLRRWTVDEIEDMLREAGFSKVTYSTTDAYAGQAMIVCAVN